MKIFDINKLKTGNPYIPSILANIDLDDVNFEDFMAARKCINLLEEDNETMEYVKNLTLFVNNNSNIDAPEQSNNENFELYYQKLDKDNKLVVNKLIFVIRPKPIQESINQYSVLKNCLDFLQAFHSAVLIDDLIENDVKTETHE